MALHDQWDFTNKMSGFIDKFVTFNCVIYLC